MFIGVSIGVEPLQMRRQEKLGFSVLVVDVLVAMSWNPGNLQTSCGIHSSCLMPFPFFLMKEESETRKVTVFLNTPVPFLYTSTVFRNSFCLYGGRACKVGP